MLWQANIQVEAGEALDIAERATTLLQQEKTQLQMQNDELNAALASQGADLADSTRHTEALEQDLNDAKKAAQVKRASESCLMLMSHRKCHTDAS